METSGEDSCVEESIDSQDVPRRFSAAQTATLKPTIVVEWWGLGRNINISLKKQPVLQG